ncbi:MAG: hypothetical protein V3U87_17875 [Methylococcaceae bacterium]
MSTPVLLSVNQFCEKHEAFKKGGIRRQIFDEKNNGLFESGAIVRIGQKLLINEEKFFNWIESNGNNAPSPEEVLKNKLKDEPTKTIMHILRAEIKTVEIVVNELNQREIPNDIFEDFKQLNIKL